MALPPELTDEERAGLAKCGFKPDTAYMPVPRCDECRWWHPLPPGDGESGLCGMAQTRPGHRKIVAVHPGHCILTAPDFGCVQWEKRK